MKKKLFAGRAMALALTLAMALSMACTTTAFAAEGDGDNGIDHIVTGEGAASAADNLNGSYPAGMAADKLGKDQSTLTVDQYANLGYTTNDARGTAADKGTIAVSGIEAGATVTAYKFIKAEYEGQPNADGEKTFSKWAETGIAGTGVAGKFVDDKTGDVTEGAFTRDNIAVLASHFAGKAGGLDMEAGNDGVYRNTKAEPGAYVIVVKAGENDTSTYGSIVVGMFYVAKQNEPGMTLKQPELGLVANAAFAKKQNGPKIDKSITAVTPTNNMLNGGAYNGIHNVPSELGNSGDVAMVGNGSLVYFDILVQNIPEYHGAHPKFVVTDTMSDGLQIIPDTAKAIAFFDHVGGAYRGTFDPNTNEFPFATGDAYHSVALPAVDVKADPDAENGGNILTWDFVTVSEDGTKTYMLNDIAGMDMVIRYAAWVVKDGLNFDENTGIATDTNAAAVDYTHNSNIEGDDGREETPERKTHTFEIVVTKLDAIDDTKVLSGAKFALYCKADNDANDMFDGEKDGWIRMYGPEGASTVGGKIEDYGVYVTGTDGKITIEALSAGEYRLVEVEAPNGYTVGAENEYLFEIKMYDKDGNQITLNSDRELSSNDIAAMKVEFHGTDGLAYNAPVILNSQMTALPSTGGAGTALLLAIGIGGVLIGLFVLFGTRKKAEE